MENFYKELHARPSFPIEAPKLISAIAFIFAGSHQSNQQVLAISEIERFIEYIYNFYREKIPEIPKGKRLIDAFDIQYIILKNKEPFIILQKHTSFFLFIFFKDYDNNLPWNAIPEDIRKNQDQFINKAAFKTHLTVEKFESNRREQDYALKETFNKDIPTDPPSYKINDVFIDLLGSKVSDDGALVWTPFNSFIDGFNRILVRDISLRPGRLGRLVRRLIEIDLYLNCAMKDFEEARNQLKKLSNYEKEINEILRKNLQHPNGYDICYNAISVKAERVAETIADSRYEFQAVVAYSELVSQRIKELREDRLEGWTRISYFLDKSFNPGVRTCQAVLRSQIAVSQEIQGVADLLEAGISLKLQRQEAEMVDNQNKREIKESRFRTAVEFLSIIAIIYYGASIIEKGTENHVFWIYSLVIFVISLCIFLYVRKKKE